MRLNLDQSLDRRAIVLWRVHGSAQALALAAASVVLASLLAPMFDWAAVQVWLIGSGVLAAGVAVTLALPSLQWRLFRFRIGANELELQRGLFVSVRTLVPLVRVQHVDIVQGPVAKLLGLATVTICTAASTHEIPALPVSRADDLRCQLSELAREARDPL